MAAEGEELVTISLKCAISTKRMEASWQRVEGSERESDEKKKGGRALIFNAGSKERRRRLHTA